jgi:pSer/pThr/pTyr-binding forkhead associated (FHA) protein
MVLDHAPCVARYSPRMLTSAARLEVVAGKAVGMSILVEDEMVIGRHAEGAGRLADDEEISRLHARVSVDADGVCTIEDLGSTNGTFLNGERISAPEALSIGDTIELGQTTLEVRELPLDEAPPPTDVRVPDDVQPPDVAAAMASAESGHEVSPVPTTLAIQLEVDFVERELQLHLDDASSPVRLVFEDGAWRVQTSPLNEKGGPA